MSSLHDLPGHVFRMIESGVVAEFVTMTAGGVPIDTPTYYFPSDDMATLDVATGVPQPAKAERARRNPKVGLLIEGRPDEPVIVVRARAAVRDSDIQSNAIRYLAETGYKGISHGITWEQARLAITYWSRIIIVNVPETIYWWDNHAALEGPPQVWRSDADTVWLQSDPAPETKMTSSIWTSRPWQDVAADALGAGHPGHLSVVDADGFPLPMRAQSLELVEEGCVADLRRVPNLRGRCRATGGCYPLPGRAGIAAAPVGARHQAGAPACGNDGRENPCAAGSGDGAPGAALAGHSERTAGTDPHREDPHRPH